MRIAYVCYLGSAGRQGVARKIEMQTEAWSSAGHDVSVHCLSDSAILLPFPASSHVFGSLRGRLGATSNLVRAVVAVRPDVVYLRYDLFMPPLVGLLRKVATVVELNSDLGNEIALWEDATPGAATYEGVNKRIILRLAAGVVCTAHELQRSVVPRGTRAAQVVIGNGVDLERLRPLPPPRNERPRAVYIGFADQPWQGVDKLVRLAELTPELDFEIVGFGREAISGASPANITYHGVLQRHEYEAVFAGADLGIGPLALHRKGLEEAATLKTREYLAYGLPTLLAQLDPDFSEEERWFLLRLPNREDNVERHANEIRTFAGAMRGRRVARHEIEENIGLANKEAQRLAFMQRCSGLDD